MTGQTAAPTQPAGKFLTVQISSIVLAPLLYVVGLTVWLVQALAPALPSLSARPTAMNLWLYAALFGLAYFAALVAHEFGHAAAGRLAGLRWQGISIGMGMSVSLGHPRTYRQQLAISVAGPGIETVIGALLVRLTPLISFGGRRTAPAGGRSYGAPGLCHLPP
jgi:hypothetical protein